MRGGNDCTTVSMYLMPLNLKMVKIVSFMLCVSAHDKKKLSRDGQVSARPAGGGRAGVLLSQGGQRGHCAEP